MAAVAGDDQKGRVDLLDPLEDALEGLPDEDLRVHLDIGEFLRHHFGPLEVGLRQLQETFVDDVVMEFFLLLELEDFRGLHRENVLDVPKHGVVVLHVERGAHVQLRPELARHFQCMAHGLVGVRRTVDANDPSTI